MFNKAIKHISNVFNALWQLMPAFLVVSLLYIILLKLDVGLDTLIVAGENKRSYPILIIALVFWSATVWFSSRIVVLIPSKGKLISNIFTQLTPRFLALNCFIILQTAILTPKLVFGLSPLQQTVFIFFHYILYALSEFSEYKKSLRLSYLSLIIGSSYFISVVVLAILSGEENEGVKKNLLFLSALFYLIQVASMITFAQRQSVINNMGITSISPLRKLAHRLINLIVECVSKWNSIVLLHKKLLMKLNIEEQEATKQAPYYFIFHCICLIGFMPYLACIISYKAATIVGPLPFVIIGFSFIILFFNLTNALTRKIGINITVLFFLALYFSSTTKTNLYSVRTIPFSEDRQHLFSVKTFLDEWLNHPNRKNEIIAATSNDRFTIYIILNDGGGARAATWSSLVLSSIDSATNGKFGNHILSMAGASGGSVGNTAFYALLSEKNKPRKEVEKFPSRVSKYFEADFLTFTLGKFLGPDLVNQLPFLSWLDDRSIALEETMEKNTGDSGISKFFSKPINEGLDNSGKLPALFLNTTNLHTGRTCYISNLVLNDSARYNILTKVCLEQTLRISTSAVLSARFPLVTPAGRLNNQYYVDGGYVDNSGAGTTQSFIREVLYHLHDTLKKKVKFTILEIHNESQKHIIKKALTPITNDFLAPLITLISMQSGSTYTGNVAFNRYLLDKNTISIQTIKADLSKKNDPDEEAYPMSWINSKYQLNRIRKQRDTLLSSEEFKRHFQYLK
jgi:hypothetical protein